MGNPGHAIIKPAHLEIALSVAPRLNQMNEICAGVIKAMRFGILFAPGSYCSLTLHSPVEEGPSSSPCTAPVLISRHQGAH